MTTIQKFKCRACGCTWSKDFSAPIAVAAKPRPTISVPADWAPCCKPRTCECGACDPEGRAPSCQAAWA